VETSFIVLIDCTVGAVGRVVRVLRQTDNENRFVQEVKW